MEIFSVTTQHNDYVVIVRASCWEEAIIMTVLAMEREYSSEGHLVVWNQSDNPDAIQRLGNRDLIGWQLKHKHS